MAETPTFDIFDERIAQGLIKAPLTGLPKFLDATITMALDECTAFPATPDEARRSMELSMRWAALSRDSFVSRRGYGLFGIVQGSVYPDLRVAAGDALRRKSRFSIRKPVWATSRP